MTATDIAAIRDALRSVAFAYVCACVHHDKKDRHDIGEPCPVEARIADAYRRMDALELAQKDAARYRWLRQELFDDEIPRVQSVSMGCIGITLDGAELDAAIDAAMSAAPQSPAADRAEP